MITWQNSQVTNKNCYMSISTWIMDTKLDKVMAHGIGPPRKNSQDFFDHLIICILMTYISNSAILQCYSSI